MELTQLIDEPSQIVAELKAANRWEAIDELIDALVRAGRIAEAQRKAVIEAIRTRETSMSTGIGNGIGIPHASTDQVKTVVGAFGRSSKGLDFDAIDGKPVQLVTLFVVPKNQMKEHLNTLAGIAKVLNNAEFRKRLKEASSPDEMFNVLRQTKK